MNLLTKIKQTGVDTSDLEKKNHKSIQFLNHIKKDNKKMHNQLTKIVEEYEKERHLA